MSDVKLCRDCKHARPDNSVLWFFFIPGVWGHRWEFAQCANEAKINTNLVTGKQTTPPKFCSTARAFSCGREAKFWSPKNLK